MYLTKQRIMGICLIVFTFMIISSSPFQQFASIPNEIRLFEGKTSHLPFSLPVAGQVISSNPEIVSVGDWSSLEEGNTQQALNLTAMESGNAEVQFKVGNIPFKRVKVNVIPETKVIPGGQSIGVRLNSAGVLVVGHHYVHTQSGKISPGEEAKVRSGDLIIKMNEVELKSLDQIGEIVEKSGKKGEPITLDVLRGRETITLTINPIYDSKEEKYRIGLYIRNSAAGVGTLTFVHPESGAYGALGHVISDVDTQKPIIVGEGRIVHSSVSSIEKGEQGQPGEKFAHFYDEGEVLGTIQRNTPFGIFGSINPKSFRENKGHPIPIGLSEEVEQGPAQIYTVVEGQRVEVFDIEVVEVVKQKFPATKGLIIKVTDPVLLEKTGGIVQGMSGSPIIQNGKLIGAVTHVFVNDPTSGYGCYIEWMLQDAGIPLHPQVLEEQKQAA